MNESWVKFFQRTPSWLVLGFLAVVCAVLVSLFFLLSCEAWSRALTLIGVGVIGYLAVVVGYAVSDDHEKPTSAGQQIATSLALGLGFACAAAVWSSFDTVSGAAAAATSDKSSPPNILTSALGLVLAIVAVFASRVAAKAKADAELSKDQAVKATRDVAALIQANHLFALINVFRDESNSLNDRAVDITKRGVERERATTYSVGAEALIHSNYLLANLYKWILEPELNEASEITETVLCVNLLCHKLHQNKIHLTPVSSRLRAACWMPLNRILETLLKTEAKKLTSAGPAGLKLATALRTLRETLQSL